MAPRTLDMILLGTGTSVGIPMVGCGCAVCRSDDPRDRRHRASALLRWNETVAVIDTTPEFRLQMLRERIDRLDAVLLTHNHADHVHGLDDVRPFCFRRPEPIPVYGDEHAIHWVRKHFAYIWEATQQGGGLPKIELRVAGAPFELDSVTITPLPAWHGITPVLGYRVGDMAYLTDVSRIPDETFALLEGVRTLILDAVRYEPHETHFHVDAAIAASRRVGAEATWFTHLSHHISHARLESETPDGMGPAWDGLRIAVRV